MENELRVELSVADVLNRWPQTIAVFLRHRMACVGCAMSTFETLASAAAIYDLDLADFMAELNTIIQSSNALREELL